MSQKGFGEPVIHIDARPAGADLAAVVTQKDNGAAPEVRFWWLGQAGFAFRHDNRLLLIDPYLSDSLAEKYRDGEFKHLRLMPVPVQPSQITGCDWYLCTHAHTDHMDPQTIRGVQQAGCLPLFVVPRSTTALAIARGVPPASMVTIDAGETLPLSRSTSIEALASAHEGLELDAAGHHKYLGYIITLGGLRLYHSGDCVPYPGLASQLAERRVDAAFLPINGRDAYRSSRGVPGNFTLGEALELCRAAGIGYVVGHHFGMFDFNTIERGAAQAVLEQEAGSLGWLLPEIGQTYGIRKEAGAPT